MRLTYRHLIGVFFLLYALAFTLRHETGLIAYIETAFNVPPLLVAWLFFACGMVLIILPVRPPWVVLLCFPLLLLVVAGAIRAASDTRIGWSGTVGHFVALAGILRWAWARSKEGGSGVA